MASSRVAFVVVGLACVAAAGTGGYLALRQNAPEPAMVATATQPAIRPTYCLITSLSRPYSPQHGRRLTEMLQSDSLTKPGIVLIRQA